MYNMHMYMDEMLIQIKFMYKVIIRIIQTTQWASIIFQGEYGRVEREIYTDNTSQQKKQDVNTISVDLRKVTFTDADKSVCSPTDHFVK